MQYYRSGDNGVLASSVSRWLGSTLYRLPQGHANDDSINLNSLETTPLPFLLSLSFQGAFVVRLLQWQERRRDERWMQLFLFKSVIDIIWARDTKGKSWNPHFSSAFCGSRRQLAREGGSREGVEGGGTVICAIAAARRLNRKDD